MKINEEHYNNGHIGQMVSVICDKYSLNHNEVADLLLKNFPELKNKTKCANCEASMAKYIFIIDTFDALLLLGMGKIVDRKKRSGSTFNISNRVHVQSELNQYYSVASRTSKCSKLGLIAKIRDKDGLHDRREGWCITKRGFDFLANRPVPRKVESFRNTITERFEEMITISELTNNNTVEGKELSTYKNYNFDELQTWSVSGYAQGTLI